MLYIINLIFSCLYLSQVKEKSTIWFLIKILPVILLWVLIVGGQYEVGQDYRNYLDFFSHPYYETRFEPLFTALSNFAYKMGVKGQGQFYLYALINAIFVFVASHKLGIKNWGVFYFLLITVSTFFNNQMNGIRQCTAVAFIYWAFVELYTKKVKGVLLMAVAGGFHYSALVCLVFTYIEKITKLLTKYPRILLIASCLISLMPADEQLNQNIVELLPEEVLEETHYEVYAEEEATTASMELIYKLSKLLLLPLYLLSLGLLKTGTLSEKDQLFLRFGILSYSLRCVLLINHLVGRFSTYFWIPAILPIYYLCENLYSRKKYIELSLVLAYASFIYFIKVFMGTAEYKSSFIYFM